LKKDATSCLTKIDSSRADPIFSLLKEMLTGVQESQRELEHVLTWKAAVADEFLNSDHNKLFYSDVFVVIP